MKITDALIKKSCSSTIYKRGMEYFKEGRVHLRKREENLINAVVDGEELYNVQVKFDGNSIKDYFCTCPYYETMGSMCKHIVASLKQRQTEEENVGGYIDENDKIAECLCNEYTARSREKDILRLKFIIYIFPFSYGVSVETEYGVIHGLENFFDCYLKGREFKFDRRISYKPGETDFLEYDRQMLDILSEAYENRSNEVSFYTKAVYQTAVGMKTAKRIFPLLEKVDYSIVFEGMTIGKIPIKNENPDILIDVEASDSDISMSVSDRGTALTADGEWFLFENTIYHTDPDWRRFFMPIYNSLNIESRTQISFRGENKVLFATKVLPEIKGRHGVVLQSVEDVIIDKHPVFEIYFDSVKNGISAVIRALYGDVAVRLPGNAEESDKIIVRDYEAEGDILASFSTFNCFNGSYTLYSDEDIYAFIVNELPALEKKARISTTSNFNKIKISDNVDISVSVRYNTEIDLLEAGFETDLSVEQISGILNAVQLKKSFYRMSNGSFLDLLKNDKKNIFEIIDQLDFTYEELKNRSKSLPKYNALYLSASGDVKKTEEFKQYIEKIKNTEPNIPKSLENVLREYQKDGIKWMKQLSSLGFGGILADDMGLGKTLQVLAYLYGERPKKPSLIVTPSALTYNWMNEINKFTPDLKAVIIDGTKEEREKTIKTIDGYDIVITSYPILRRDILLYKDKYFAYCFIDEAQHIKNPKTMNARSVKRINAGRRFALTGTPIENSLTELWSIFDFAIPGYLYTLREFKVKYETPFIKNSKDSAAAVFKARIHPFILRRMKTEVLNELPEKIENTIFADLTAEQKQMYSSYLALAKKETVSLLQEGQKIRILTLLMRLRQICCHPVLFDSAYEKDSGKLNLLLEVVQNAVESGHRILIFSQFTSMLEIIRKNLDLKKTESFYLDGKTPAYERAELSERFNDGERSVFLISLKAGGTGLNLTGADMVIHYDPWWNPAVTDQASDRAYRIGQTKVVQVMRLAARGTIEDKILKLQEKKRFLAEDIITANNDAFSKLTNEEILSLFE